MTVWVLFFAIIGGSGVTIFHYELKDKEQCQRVLLNMKKHIHKNSRGFCQEIRK